MGSFGFDLTVQDIYEAVDTEFATEEIKLKAATDDLTIGVPTREYGDDAEVWDLCKEILEFIAEESQRRAGLELNFSK